MGTAALIGKIASVTITDVGSNSLFGALADTPLDTLADAPRHAHPTIESVGA
jgi:hypothetical protein